MPRAYQNNIPSNKPNVEKRTRYANDINYFSSRLIKKFGFKIRSPVSVVAEIIRNSQEIDVCCNDIKNLTYDEDITLLFPRICDLEWLNEDLVEKSFDLMIEMMMEIVFSAETYPAIEANNSADVPIDNYDETI